MIYLLFTISIFTTVTAHLLFKKGVFQLGEINFSFPQIFSVIWQVLQNIWILLGMVLFGISFLTWLFILSKMQLSIAYPILIGVQVVLVTLGSWLVFHGHLSWPQVLGVALVIIGIFLISPKGSI